MATGTWKWYRNGLRKFLLKYYDWQVDSFAVTVFQSDYTPNQDADEFYTTIDGNVAITANVALAGKTLVTSAGGVIGLKADNVTGTGALTGGRYAIIYKSTAPYELIGYLPVASDVSGSSSWSLTLDQTNGFLTIDAA